MSGPLEVDFKT